MPARLITYSRDMEPLGDAVIAIGVFDGFHKGHQRLIEHLIVDSIFRGIPSVVVTFDPDPEEVLSPATTPPRLLSHEDRLDLLSHTDVHAILTVPFTKELSFVAPRVFLNDWLSTVLTPKAIHVGQNFRFGAGGIGTVTTLKEWGEAHDCEIFAYPLTKDGEVTVSSSEIRRLIACGEVSQAAHLMGRPYKIRGIVHHGRGQGHALGFPTANVGVPDLAALPAEGVYAARAYVNGELYKAAVNVGVPPTFSDAHDSLEVHLLNFDGDLYDDRMDIEFLRYLRPLKRFSSREELVETVAADIASIYALEI